MARLFLIRRNLEHFIGPMTVGELKDAYKRMEFGLQDEVAGHCGVWVAFDNMDVLRECYPDLSKVVAEDMLGGWGLSTHSTETNVKQKKKKKRSQAPASPKKPAGLSGFVWGLGLAVILSVCVFGVVYYKPLLSRILPEDADYSVDQAQDLLQTNDWQAFDIFMERIMPDLVPRLNKSMRVYRDWIPFVRSYAYRRDGVVEGVKPKMLRGLGSVLAPTDCASAVLKDKLNGENIAEVMSGKALPRGEFSRLLVWDPHWIRRRADLSGWRTPRNYYEACLIMAVKAWQTASFPQKEQIRGVDTRLNSLLAIIRGEGVRDDNDLPPVWAAMQCLNKSDTVPQADACVFPEGDYPVWRDYFDYQKRHTQMRLLWASGSSLSEADKALLSKVSSNIAPQDELSRFDYGPELKFVRVILLNSGKLDEAYNRMRLESPDIDFKPP